MTRLIWGYKIIFGILNIMKYKNFGILLAVIAGILIWQAFFIIKSEPEQSVSSPEIVVDTQQSAGDVSVEINYLSGKSGETNIVFEISLNTHSVDLDDIDFQKAVVLQKGGQTFAPSKVENSGSGHHRSAELSFPGVGVPLKIVFLGTAEIEKKELEFKELPATSFYLP